MRHGWWRKPCQCLPDKLLTMKRLLITIGLALTVTSGLLVLAAPAAVQAQGFNISKGIVGNLANDACREQGDCGWCDFVDMMVIIQKIILYMFGSLALVMIIWGGFGVVTAAGNQEKITANRKVIISTLFGVLIILAAYFLVSAILAILLTPTRQRPSSFLGAEWWRDTLHCYSPQDGNKFCAAAPDGKLCYVNSKPYLCKAGICDTSADACKDNLVGLGSAASCGSITRPGCQVPSGRREDCKPPNCALNVCEGSSTNVCCLPTP